MKTFVKLGLVGLALAASTAQADIALPSTGNGELTLFVRNETTGVVYARGLGITMNNVLSQETINGTFNGIPLTGETHQLGYSIPTIGPDANLAGFLNDTDAFTWTIMGGDSLGSNNATPDARRYLTTTQVLFGNPDTTAGAQINAVTNNNLVSYSSLNTMLTNVNSGIAGTTIGDGGSTPINGMWRQANNTTGNAAGNWFGPGPNNVNQLGEAAHLYVLTTAGGGNGGTVRTYQGFDVVLGLDGTLAVVPPPAVPLPPAAWMLVSGLLTLAGVGRRRKNALASAAA